MKAKEVQKKMNKMLESEQYVELRNWLSRFPIYYWNGKNYTDTNAAAIYDSNGSCTNAYIKCEDGFIEYPF